LPADVRYAAGTLPGARAVLPIARENRVLLLVFPCAGEYPDRSRWARHWKRATRREV